MNNKKTVEVSNVKLTELNSKLEYQNELATKSKKSREKFLSEIRSDIIEDAIVKITKDLATILNHEEGNVIITKQAKVDLHKKMLDSCAKILSYVSDSLNLSQIDIKNIIEEAIEVNNHDANINNVSLISNISDKLTNIYVDQRAIKHVIISLINYAMEDRKRNKDDSFIKITANNKKEQDQQFLEIIFEDNGHGISEEMRTNFEESSEKKGKDKNHIGLSLYAIKYILTLHGATLDINNIAGEGSLITIQIPYKTPDAKKGESQLKSKSKKENKKKESGKISNVIELFPSTSKKD